MGRPATDRRRGRKANPNEVVIEHDWSDEAIVEHWPSIVSLVGARELPDLSTAEFIVLGCGAFGCVMATNREDMVFKVTVDASEAAFVAAALELGRWPPGVVRYDRIVELAGTDVDGDRVYALWREAAEDVGRLDRALDGLVDPPREFHKSYLREASMGLRRVARGAMEIQLDLGPSRSKKSLLHQAEDYLDDAREAYVDGGVEPGFSNSAVGQRVLSAFVRDKKNEAAARIAWFMVDYDEAIDRLSMIEPLKEVAAALAFYAEHGLALADVHLNNVGYVRRGRRRELCITDPGVMVPMSPRWLSVDIQQVWPDGPEGS